MREKALAFVLIKIERKASLRICHCSLIQFSSLDGAGFQVVARLVSHFHEVITASPGSSVTCRANEQGIIARNLPT